MKRYVVKPRVVKPRVKRRAAKPRSIKRAAAAAVALCCLIGGTTAATAGSQAPTPGSAGMGDSYFPQYGNGGYDVGHYDVRNRVELDTGRLVGVTAFRAVAGQSLSRFNVDLVLPVRAVSVNGHRAAFSRTNRHEVQIRPRTPIADDASFVVRVAYAGRPGAISWGGERPWQASRREVVAMGEPQMAAWWFAANDHPRDKAVLDVRITVERGLQAISNGKLKAITRGTRWTVWHWRADEPMAPYLAFFAAGRYTIERGRTADGLPWLNAVSKELDPYSRTESTALMRQTPRVIAWLEGWLGPYPFSTTGGLTTSLDAGFALENQTRPTYPSVGGRESTWLVVHELAHQWFGDRVSVDNWRDIWLNEGPATYLETLWSGNGGEATPQAWLLSTWESIPANSDFWKLKIGDPGPGRLFDGPIYDRGAMTMQALRHRIGDTDFKALLRAWVRGPANGSTADFTALAESVSGEDLDAFFDAWLFTGSRPARTADNGLA
ncbi:M1 family metallopeptidase [Nocardioides sp. Root151]|uniref:M1 family metallopeptidase n=1 Tax=Nocardioides sp. Root151 TaxID=1736475 RepID=UPI0007030D3D|nr:M1 family metallopeptidase [Nocardioides sp. Root151]KQZ69768.1 hypothetical protein ASD66_08615 [Nocardioides sp. Root151]